MKPRRSVKPRFKSKLLGQWKGQVVSGNDIALDFMTEHEVAEILATEELLEVDMQSFDENNLYEDVATDSDYD